MAVDLEVRELCIEYSSGGYPVRPVDGLDLDLHDGQLVLLLGASGCGKTSLLSVLAAILTPAAGQVRLGDIDVTALEGRALRDYRRHTVGVVFQAFNLLPSLSALDNVQVPMWAAGVPHRRARERAAELLAQVGLEERLAHAPGRLSGGQQQRVAIARALANDPPLILADEPTAHLDYIQVEGVIRLLRTLAAPGRLLVVATHDERLLPLADRVVELTPRAAPISGEPHRRTLSAGEVLFRQGDQSDLVWEVESGRIQIVGERDDGGEDLLATVSEGRYFGELGPMFALRRSATARAEVDSVVVGYTLTDFKARRREHDVAGILGAAGDS